MPRFKDACGCYNKSDAAQFGLATAVVWFDVLNHAEIHNINPVWYDQKRASERLGIPCSTISDSINKLTEAGRLKKKVGYRPGTTVKTTWLEIIAEDLDGNQKSGDRISKESGGRISILKDNNNKNTETSKEKSSSSLDEFISLVLETAGFSPTATKIREATPAAKKALQDKIPKEDIIKAAEAIKMVRDGKVGQGLTPSVRSPFQRPDFWAAQKPAEAPKGAW